MAINGWLAVGSSVDLQLSIQLSKDSVTFFREMLGIIDKFNWLILKDNFGLICEKVNRIVSIVR